MVDDTRSTDDRAFADAIAAFDRFVNKESGFSGAHLHLVRRIVEDEVVDAEAAGKDWKLHHRL